jgi:hypothetical protein
MIVCAGFKVFESVDVDGKVVMSYEASQCFIL